MANQLFALTGQYLNVSQFPSLAAANTAAVSGGFGLNIDKGVTLSSNLTVTATPIIFNGGVISTGTFTLTINSQFNATPVRIFDTTGGGSVTTAKTGLCEQVFLEWFGAVGDGSTDDTTAANAAWTFATLVGATLIPLAKTYFFNGTVTKAAGFDCASVIGEVTGNGFCQFKGNGTNTLVNIIGSSGRSANAIVSNIHFINAAVGIETNGQCGVTYDLCVFGTTAGVLLHNKLSGQFTEDNVITQCNFSSTCVKYLEYKFTSGATSFHGSGFGQGAVRNIGQPSSNSVVATITSGFVYNAPFYVHVNNQTNVTVNYFSCISATVPDFYGVITGEIVGSGSMVISDTAQHLVYFAGPIHFQGLVTYGLLIQPSLVTRRGSNNGLENVFVPLQSVVIPGTATFTLPELYLDARRVCLQLSGGGYNKMYIIDLLKSDVTNQSASVIALTLNISDTGSYGATTISTATSGALTVTNTNFPSNTVSAFWTCQGYGLAVA